MFKPILTVMAALILCHASGASAQTLGIGDPAPKLEVKEFVKGKPFSKFEKGRTYVVEFWATWCGPCRTSIPHLTALQKKHKEVTFLGVSVFENDQKAVKPFVKEMGDKMGYSVAMDDVPAGAGRGEGKMAKSWMQAAGQDGIPAAFIINGEGRIAWIGHPMSMDKPLEQIVAGKWDIEAAIAANREEQAQRRKMAELRGKLTKAQQSGDPKKMLEVIDEAITDDPKMESMLGLQRLFLLVRQIGDKEKALQYGEHLLSKPLKDNPQALNGLAWMLVDPDAPKLDPAFAGLAVRAAERADELTGGKDAAVADTLAKAYFDNGSPAKALETQERAIQLAKGTPLEKDPGLQARLEQYKKAVGK